MSSSRRTELTTVQVDLTGRGAWEVAAPAEHAHIDCATLDEARIIAYRWADERRPCELIVRDAYHRVLRREIVSWHTG